MPLNITASRSSAITSSYRVSKPKRPDPLASRKKNSSSSSSSFSLTSTSISPAAARRNGRTNNPTSAPRSHPHQPIPLPDHGPAPCISLSDTATTSIPTTTVDMIAYITSHMFDPIPARRSGMNSTRIAEVLNFRRALPPIVTKGHVLALSSSVDSSGSGSDSVGGGYGVGCRSYTAVERDIAGLVARGVVRKVAIPGLVAASGSGKRGVGDRFRLGGAGAGASTGGGGVDVTTAGGEGLVLVREWERMVEECTELPVDIKKKYLSALHANPSSPTITLSSTNPTTSSTLTPTDATILIRTGFLTSSSSSSSSTSSSPSLNQPPPKTTPNTYTTTTYTYTYTFSLPNTGPYLYLLRTAKEHLRSLALKISSTTTKTSKREIRELPRSILKMRWDGTGTGIGSTGASALEYKHEHQQNILVDPSTSSSSSSSPQPYTSSRHDHNDTDNDNDNDDDKNNDNDAPAPRPAPIGTNTNTNTNTNTAIPNARIRKWKHFRGLAFDWVLAECVGVGGMECFATGAVGVGVRLC